MRLCTLCSWVSGLLAFPAVLFTLLLYLYPVFLGCSFPETVAKGSDGWNSVSRASKDVAKSSGTVPFRLLALGDPQLEGDTSLPSPNDPILPNYAYLRSYLEDAGLSGDPKRYLGHFKDIFKQDIPLLLWSYRKRLDLIGNDLYLAHIYRTLHWWLQPTHVTVLGDLLGSQWISNDEFARRGSRFWNIVFRNGLRVDHSATGINTTELLGQDLRWSRRIINIAGNHDIGYAGDINIERLNRFEAAFGKANWEAKFRLAPRNSSSAAPSLSSPETAPELRIVVLNNMLLDGPAYDPELQKSVYDFINDPVIKNSHSVDDKSGATILLTHVPLYKKAGVCKDGPFIDYSPTGVKEQNHLSLHASRVILESIYGMSGNPNASAGGLGRNGIILNGHDHEGCDVLHYMPPELERDEDGWAAIKWSNAAHDILSKRLPRIREITVRSMMGSFGGNAGLLSAWFDDDLGAWRFEYATCALGVQHIWWAVHVFDLIVLGFAIVAVLGKVVESIRPAAMGQKYSASSIRALMPLISKNDANGHAISKIRTESPSLTLKRRKRRKKNKQQ